MAYSRFSDSSDVYLIRTNADLFFYACIGCGITEHCVSMSLWSAASALAHMQRHRDAGHPFPDSAIERLQADVLAEQSALSDNGT